MVCLLCRNIVDVEFMKLANIYCIILPNSGVVCSVNVFLLSYRKLFFKFSAVIVCTFMFANVIPTKRVLGA